MSDYQITTLQHRILTILLDETNEGKRMTPHAILDRVGIAKFGSQHVMKSLLVAVNALRARGYPICSSNSGYFYARRDESVLNFINALKKKIEPIEKLVHDMEKTYPNVGGISSSVRPKVTVAVRSGSGAVKYISVDIGEDGEPIIPPDVEPI